MSFVSVIVVVAVFQFAAVVCKIPPDNNNFWRYSNSYQIRKTREKKKRRNFPLFFSYSFPHNEITFLACTMDFDTTIQQTDSINYSLLIKWNSDFMTDNEREKKTEKISLQQQLQKQQRRQQQRRISGDNFEKMMKFTYTDNNDECCERCARSLGKRLT